MPHPAVTCSNQALSEITYFHPSGAINSAKPQLRSCVKQQTLCWAQAAAAQAGASVHTPFQLLWLPCCQGHSQHPTWTWGLGFLSEGTGMGLVHSWTSTQELEQHHGSSGITLTSKMIFCCPKAPKRPICGSGTGSNLLLLQRFLPQDLCAAPGAQGSSAQSQVVCMVPFSVRVQGSIVGLGLCTGTKKWFNKKIEL